MVQMIKGEPVTLTIKTPNGQDDFGQPIFTESTEVINNVIVGSPSSEDVINEMSLTGKHILFVLGIPKEDNHSWTNTEVVVRGMKCRTIGIPIEYTPGMMPNWWNWNKQIKVERYE